MTLSYADHHMIIWWSSYYYLLSFTQNTSFSIILVDLTLFCNNYIQYKFSPTSHAINVNMWIRESSISCQIQIQKHCEIQSQKHHAIGVNLKWSVFILEWAQMKAFKQDICRSNHQDEQTLATKTTPVNVQLKKSSSQRQLQQLQAFKSWNDKAHEKIPLQIPKHWKSQAI